MPDNTDKPEKEVTLAMHSLGTKLSKRGSRIVASGFCVYRFRDRRGKTVSPDKIRVKIGNNESCADLKFKGKGISIVKGIRLGRYEISFDESVLSQLDMQNKLFLCYDDMEARIGYSVFDRDQGKSKTSSIVRCGEQVCYLKQSVYNGMYLTVREPQIYDEAAARKRVFFAWLAAKFWPKNNIIYLFEKECAGYEESGSVLYEKLIDLGYDNAYFVVNEDNPAIADLDEKYKNNLIYKDSFKHLLYFFKSRVFIASETMAHAMQLRASDKRIVRKTESKRISYVFLQHGVMYMVSLSADLRVSFRQKGLDLYRVVVSSQLEADHFIDLAGFEPEELYNTGLAKFDRSVRYDDADRIVIMPTWRRWEANQAREDITKTKYYKMIDRMVDAVPENLKDKIIILPHPLMRKAMSGGENELSKYLATETHNDTLKQCDLLITDYSSIAYDAFYRGSNIIFCWEEKEECMEQYGPETTLMLTEELAFGDVCYETSQITDSIGRLYGQSQPERYKDNYSKIVEHHDNRNSERIVELLKKDGVL